MSLQIDHFQNFYHSLRTVNSKSLWGQAIKDFTSHPTVIEFCQLIDGLKSQYKDNPVMMAQILGPECFNCFLKVIEPKGEMLSHKYSEIIGAGQMREIAALIRNEIPGLGFALFVFEFGKAGISNYISNAQRSDMILALKEKIKILEEGKDFPTSETN